jgi:glucose/arabinose dehydrogenase
MQMLFYDGSQFPGEFRGDAFVALHGSWNRKPPSGYEVKCTGLVGGRLV